jgi:DNA-binding MarR family transcriptional regulator
VIAASDDLSTAEYRALADFRFLIRQFLHFSEQETRARGIEAQQHQALLALRSLPDDVRPTVGELAARLMIRHHSAVELVNRLSERAAVERVHGEEDQRQVLLRLTNKGRRLLRDLALVHRAELERAGPQLARALQKATRRRARGGAA